MESPSPTPDTIVIRPGREEDAAGYRTLRLEALRNHPEAFSADYATAEARRTSFWLERLRSGGAGGVALMQFAERDGELIGMCGIFFEDSPKIRHTATIVSMYVKAPWRSRGIGERLVMACLEWARANEVRTVKLAVVTTNMPAMRCYSRCGFRVYGIEPQALQWDGVFYDEMLMSRPV